MINLYVGYLAPRGPIWMFSAIHSLETSVLSGPSKTLPISPEMPVHLQHVGFIVQRRTEYVPMSVQQCASQRQG